MKQLRWNNEAIKTWADQYGTESATDMIKAKLKCSRHTAYALARGAYRSNPDPLKQVAMSELTGISQEDLMVPDPDEKAS
ncbi:MAG: hypothetical protein CMB99_16070 [Flavobacteriaceae bacterium]|jgi:hypothetical protein|nr:hypothetical protein [Flavobacteriaceae bacterium]|tara:strand:+ start:27474 stop:27713 length:240 start_codon:yes stop_codon:yes gene_type:complete